MEKNILNLVGGIPTPLKNMSQLGLLFPIYGNIKHVPNHQPVNTQVPKISQHILWLFPSLFASDLWLLSWGYFHTAATVSSRTCHAEQVFPDTKSTKQMVQARGYFFLCIWLIWPWYFTPFFTWDTSPKNIYYGYIYPLKKSETADQLPPQSLTKCHMEVLGSGFRKWSNTSWEVPELFTLSRLITPIALWFIGVIYGHKPTIYVYILVIATIIAMMVYIPMMVYNNGLNDYIVYQHQFHYDISNYLLWSIYQQYLHLLWFLLTNETTSLRGRHLVMGISGEVTGSHFQ